MFKSITLDNFKCFRHFETPLNQINLFTGYNGAGKSTVFQAILLLAQSVRGDSLRDLHANGHLLKLGSVEELINFGSGDNFSITLTSDEPGAEKIKFSFEANKRNSRIGDIVGLSLNEVDQFAVSASIQGVTSPEIGEQRKTLQTSDWSFINIFKKIHYISASRLGPSLYEERSDLSEENPIGQFGEHKLEVLNGQPDLQSRIAGDIAYIMNSPNKMNVPKSDKSSSTLNLFFDSKDGSVHSVNTGFGFSYIIPILLACELYKGGKIFVENPEAHLHPQAQSRLMQVIADKAIKHGNQLFVESHSEHILNGLRLACLLPDNAATYDKLELCYFGEGEPEQLAIDEDAQVSPWPEGFFDQQQKDCSEILSRGILR